MCSNIWRPAAKQQEAAAVRPGRPVELHAPADVDQLTVVDPDGKRDAGPAVRAGRVPVSKTDTPGVYQVRQGDRVDRAIRRQSVRSRGERRWRAAEPGSGESDGAAGRHPHRSRRRCGRDRSRPRPAGDVEDPVWRVPCSCWCWNGISTTDGCISNAPGMEVALDRDHGREFRLTMLSNPRAPRHRRARVGDPAGPRQASAVGSVQAARRKTT